MEVYSTADAPRRGRAAWWTELYARRFAEVTVTPGDDEAFEAELRLGAVGPLRLACVQSSGAAIERTRRHAERTSERLFSFLLPLEGRAVFSHYGCEAVLEPGDVTLCDNALPHHLRLVGDSRLLVVRVSPELLRRRLPAPEKLCGARLPAQAGLAPAASALARNLWDQLQAGLPEVYGERIAGHLLDLMATSYAMAFGADVTESAAAAGHRRRVKQYVEARLADPDLAPSAVADALGISPRYLRMLAAADGESLSSYILRRRLEECARQISSPAWRGRTVTEAAFAWGFNSPSHFTRAFKARFGSTPSDYRSLGQGACAG